MGLQLAALVDDATADQENSHAWPGHQPAAPRRAGATVTISLTLAERDTLACLLRMLLASEPNRAVSKTRTIRAIRTAALRVVAQASPATATRTMPDSGCQTQPVTRDAAPDVRVALVGAFGRGHTAIVDADAWERIKSAKGDQWTRHRDATGRWYVGSLRERSVWLAKAVLDRKVQGAAIIFKNDHEWDCRRANLVVKGDA